MTKIILPMYVEGDDIFEEIGVSSIILFSGHSDPARMMCDSPLLKRASSMLPTNSLNNYFDRIIGVQHKTRGFYGLMTTEGNQLPGKSTMKTPFGLFQNRTLQPSKCNVEIIKQSVRKLAFWMDGKYERVALEYPGTDPHEVAEILKLLEPLGEKTIIYQPPEIYSDKL